MSLTFLKKNKGQLVIELLVTIALSSLFLPALLTGMVASRDGRVQQEKRTKAVSMINESKEALRVLREAGWVNISTNGIFYELKQGSAWILQSGILTDGEFTKSVTISNVLRDTSGNVVESAGLEDPSTKKIVIEVSWTIPRETSVSETVYLSRYRNNEFYTETTHTQFNNGVINGVAVRATTGSSLPDDGEVVLGAGGRGDWCNPSLIMGGLNLTGNGVATDITATEGRAFVATGQNASGMDFINIGISNPAYPELPIAVEEGIFDGNLKSNSVFGETINGHSYGYITTSSNTKEVVILNSDGVPFLIASINLPGPPSGDSVFVKDNILYATGGNYLFTYDVSDRTNPVFLDSQPIVGSGKKVMVAGEHAFIAINSSSIQLEVIDVSNPSSMINTSTFQASTGPARGLFVNSSGDRVYLITAGQEGSEFFIINTSNKNLPSIVPGGNFNTSGMEPNAVTVVPGNRAIIVGNGGYEYQVLNLDIETSPSLCGFLDTPAAINGISTVREQDGDVYSYIITTNLEEEFRMIIGGPGGIYSTSGVFESEVVELSASSAAVNRFSSTFIEPSGTDIRFQVSVSDKVSGVCSASDQFTFIGPDGTTNSFFTPTSGENITVPLTIFENYKNPGICFKYKAFLSTTVDSSSPVLKDFTVNYSL